MTASHDANRLASLQVARAFAAIAVVLVHVWGVTGNIAAVERPGLFAFGQAGVDQFFVISGFIIPLVTTRPQSAGQFFKRRALRIFPFYWAFTLIWLAMLWATARPVPGLDFTIWSALALPLNEPPLHGVGWSLEHEFIFYLLAGLLIAVDRKSWLLPVLAGLTAISFLGHLLMPGWFSNVWPAHLLSPYHFEFLMGVILFRIRHHLHRLPYLPMLIAGAVLFPIASAILNWAYVEPIPTFAVGPLGVLRAVLFGIPRLLILGGLLALERQRPKLLDNRPARWAEELGNASYALYLAHPLVIAVLAVVYARIWPAGLSLALAVAVAVAASVLFSLIWYRLVERPLLLRLEKSRPTPPIDGPA